MPVANEPRALYPVAVRAPHGASMLEIEWADRSVTRYRHTTLRGFCPCAGCQGHEGPLRWVPGTEALSPLGLELRSIVPVGNYALALGWGDGHEAGIYTFRYLRELAPLHALSPEQERAWSPARG